ncbi:MAG: GNAT family N-acetyltransferase [Deinococcota bacterium]|jgi:ribosomal protein S18 acetylase RimI-like enzyme|nr:GNAT family N-acetyltransferase [Deinococcota bacterium]
MSEERFRIRPYEPGDLEALYEICLKTGDAGSDASHLYDDPKVLGHLYAAPYAVLEPELAFVLVDNVLTGNVPGGGRSVCGYILGTLDTDSFKQAFVNAWLPKIREQYPEPAGDPGAWTPTERLAHSFHHPKVDVLEELKGYPSHLHIDLLPRAQGQGNGTRLMHTFLSRLKEMGSPAVHLGLGSTNTKAHAFYKGLGFAELLRQDHAIYMGMRLDERA